MEKFKATYPEMYYLVITKFVYDENGNIQHGKFMGEIKIYEENGKPIMFIRNMEHYLQLDL